MRKLQRGFSIVSAIFLLVVLAFLGVAMVTFSTTQHQSAAMDVMGSRAYQAARAGIEWAAYGVSQQPASSAVPWPGCAAPPAIVVAGDLAPFSPVTVNCSAVSNVEGASTIWIYDVSAIAQTTGSVAGDQDYVQRVISVKLGK
jgi:MSHA biogenesis protein MshP